MDNKKSINFECLRAKDIYDEHSRRAKNQVMTQLIDQHKTKRHALFFAQIVTNHMVKRFYLRMMQEIHGDG